MVEVAMLAALALEVAPIGRHEVFPSRSNRPHEDARARPLPRHNGLRARHC